MILEKIIHNNVVNESTYLVINVKCLLVMPAKAGIQVLTCNEKDWMPAFAGMTRSIIDISRRSILMHPAQTKKHWVVIFLWSLTAELCFICLTHARVRGLIRGAAPRMKQRTFHPGYRFRDFNQIIGTPT